MKKAIHPKPGDKFYKLTVVSYHHTGKHNRRYFVFRCDCGNEKILHGSNVTSGNTRSCGCLIKEGHKKRILPDHGVCKNNLLLQYKRHARQRGFCFELTKEKFVELISMPCYYCGLPPSNFKTTKNDSIGILYSGIDRVDPLGGYTEENVVPCCKMCNRSKNNHTREDFLNWIKSVYIHQSKVN